MSLGDNRASRELEGELLKNGDYKVAKDPEQSFKLTHCSAVEGTPHFVFAAVFAFAIDLPLLRPVLFYPYPNSLTLSLSKGEETESCSFHPPTRKLTTHTPTNWLH
jgi:hypothetical protein